VSAAAVTPQGYFERLRLGLRRTREGILGRVTALLQPGAVSAPDWKEDLEAALLQADIGPVAAGRIVSAVRTNAGHAAPSWSSIRDAARSVLKEMLLVPSKEPVANGTKPHVYLLVGVNGGGKTTTAGKLARRLTSDGRRVMLCAADTFRAGAGEQLRIWAERAGAEFAGHRPGADPSAVVFDAAAAAVAHGFDALIIDTAGRLHTQDPLMRELDKVVRVVGRQVAAAPHDVLLVLDATTGQNGVNQATRFLEAARVSGLVLTKIDGTARGGVAVRIVQELGIPLRYVGVGEGIDDLLDFDPEAFVDGLLTTAA
jgi:fused signal recognition particle receptor